MTMRLDRYLTAQTALSRRACSDAVRQGRVTVNGGTVRTPEQKITPGADSVTLDGKPVLYSEFHYFLMHKPCRVITASRDKHAQTVLDLLQPEDRLPGLFACGRLDKDTSGLLLITDDGQLSHRLLSPKHHVTKYYLVQLARPFEPAYIDALAQGITLRDGADEEPCLPAECEPIGEKLCVVGLHEGKYHQVRRSFAALGNHVESLLRTGIGGLNLPPELAPGGYLAIFTKDVEKMLNPSSISLAASFCRFQYSSYWIKEPV